MRRAATAFVLAAACVARAAAGPPPDAWNDPGDIRSFMVMTVCADASDQVIRGLSPLDAACTTRRKIRPGEAIPYHLHNFPPADAPCRARQGSVSKDNVPVIRNGVARIVSYYDRAAAAGCDDEPSAEQPAAADPGKRGGSVQWADEAFGFIMGSWSPVSLSYLRAPGCAAHPSSSEAMFRGWVIAPSRTAAITQAIGYGVFASKLDLGSPARTFGACPPHYHRSFNTWTRAESVPFRSGARLGAIIASHYARADAPGASPGASEQMERTYWTAEFGLTRWEKWARADWVNPRNHRSAAELARIVRDTGTCGRGHPMAGKIGTALAVTPADTQDGYGERLTSEAGGTQWLMTLCQDYSNIVMDADPGPPAWAATMDPAYWQVDRPGTGPLQPRP